MPYLIGLATASNIGSVATITGNPQNIIIGNLSGISYVRFAARLAPVAALGLVIDFVVLSPAVLAVARRGQRRGDGGDRRPAPAVVTAEPRVHRGLLVKCLCVTAAMIGLFFAGQPIAIVALAAAAILLLDRVRPEKVYHQIDWPLLVMFAGLFIVVHAVRGPRGALVEPRELDGAAELARRAGQRAVGRAVEPGLERAGGPPVQAADGGDVAEGDAWLALAMSSTLAGNLTMLGSVANLIVVESARRSRVELGFGEFLKVGIPLTLLTTLVGVAWLAWTHY